MPREFIHDLDTYDGEKSPFVLSIAWQRDQDVVVGTENIHKAIGDDGRGWFLSLNRKQINEAIKVLRRARDQAYGKDE